MSRSQVRRPVGAVDLGSDDTGCTILHVDMDAFYASVELRTRPDLKGKPVIVGGGGNRGVVLSATYEARALGIHSAMPMSRARRVAPSAIVLQPHHRTYAQVSRNVMEIFRSITPIVQPLSLDEAFLDVAGAARRLGSARLIAEQIRARVEDEQQITCSVGVAPNKFIAKLASTRCKPDGLLVIPADRILDFLHPLPVGALWGVGEKTEDELRRLGLATVGDLASTPLEALQHAVGPGIGAHLHALAWGRDARSVEPQQPDRSVGNEETFERDIDDPERVRAHLLALATHVAGRLRSSGLVGRTVAIKVRFSDFRTITRSRTIPVATDVGTEIYQVARELYDALDLGRTPLRLVGVRVENLVTADAAPRQLLLGEAEHGHRDAELAIDALRERFGSAVVRPARLVDPKREIGYEA